MQGQIQVVWETVILVRGPNLWSPNIIFQVLIFQLYFNKNVLKLAINNFTMHLIILKWLRRQKCRQKRKTMRQRDVKARQEIICKCSLFYFDFFMNCSKSLSDVNSLHYLPHLFSSDPFAALTGL